MRTNASLQSRKKEKILELRGLNYTYREIQEAIPGVSKGSISYHCGEGQKEKSREINRKGRKAFVARSTDLFMASESPISPPFINWER